MDPASIFILKHRLQAVVFKRNLVDNFSKIFQPTAGPAENALEGRTKLLESEANDVQETLEGQTSSGKSHSVHESEGEARAEDEALPNSMPIEEEQTDLEIHRELSVEEEQARRDETYITFEGEEEIDDYTSGPARFVPGFDGVKDCAALLFTYDLSKKLQRALKGQRIYEKTKRHAEEQIESIRQFEEEIRDEILNHRIRIANAEDHNDTSPDAETQAEITSCKGALEVLEQMESDVGLKKQIVEANLDWKSRCVVEDYAEVAAYLDEALVHTGLMEPDSSEEEPVEKFDLHEQYQKKLHKRREAVEDHDVSSCVEYFEAAPAQLDTTTPEESRLTNCQPLSEEALAKDKIFQTLWEAQDRVSMLQHAFDNKKFEQERDYAELHRADAEGRPIEYTSQSDFDLKWLASDRDLTHELIEAEKRLSQAKAAALEAGVRFQNDDTSSCFGEDFNCTGYPISQEIDVEGCRAWVEDEVCEWLEEVPEDGGEDCEGDVEVDEWEFRELDLSDSISCVEVGKRRRKIDGWQRDCRVRREGSEKDGGGED